jgi:hypothetical protein
LRTARPPAPPLHLTKRGRAALEAIAGSVRWKNAAELYKLT